MWNYTSFENVFSLEKKLTFAGLENVKRSRAPCKKIRNRTKSKNFVLIGKKSENAFGKAEKEAPINE